MQRIFLFLSRSRPLRYPWLWLPKSIHTSTYYTKWNLSSYFTTFPSQGAWTYWHSKFHSSTVDIYPSPNFTSNFQCIAKSWLLPLPISNVNYNCDAETSQWQLFDYKSIPANCAFRYNEKDFRISNSKKNQCGYRTLWSPLKNAFWRPSQNLNWACNSLASGKYI